MKINLGFTWKDVLNVFVHALIVAAAILLAGVLGMVDASVFGSHESEAAVLIASAIVALKRFILDNSR